MTTKPLPWREVYSRLHERCGYGGTMGDARRARKAYKLVAVAVPRGGRVLDLGCGRGLLVRKFRGAGYDAVGLEFSPWLLEHDLADVPHIAGDVTDLSGFPAKGYDAVTAIDVLEHLDTPDVARRAAAEMARIARRRIVISVGLGDPHHEIDGIEYHEHQVQAPPEWWREVVAACVHDVGVAEIPKTQSWIFWGRPRRDLR